MIVHYVFKTEQFQPEAVQCQILSKNIVQCHSDIDNDSDSDSDTPGVCNMLSLHQCGSPKKGSLFQQACSKSINHIPPSISWLFHPPGCPLDALDALDAPWMPPGSPLDDISFLKYRGLLTAVPQTEVSDFLIGAPHDPPMFCRLYISPGNFRCLSISHCLLQKLL